MKVIFLDVDGVLNNINYTKKCYKRNDHKAMSMYYTPFDRKCLKNLAKIVRKTVAKIVLTSTWRLDKEHIVVLKSRLAEYGLQIFDKTDNINMNRGAEIDYYIKHNRNTNTIDVIDKFVIIDDGVSDILPYYGYEYIVQTNPDYGLTFGDRIRAINKLK